MDTLPTTLTLNEKAMVLLSFLEEYMRDNEKKMPAMLKMMYKPALNTLSIFSQMIPEEKLREYLQHARHMQEAIECNHSTRQEFVDHIHELLQLWT